MAYLKKSIYLHVKIQQTLVQNIFLIFNYINIINNTIHFLMSRCFIVQTDFEFAV